MDSLGTIFKNAIVEKDGISSEEVTPAYIHEQREKRFYPNVIYDSEREGLRSLTRNQFKGRGALVDEVLGEI